MQRKNYMYIYIYITTSSLLHFCTYSVIQTISSVPNFFHCLLPRFKGSYQELVKYIKSFERAFRKHKL